MKPITSKMTSGFAPGNKVTYLGEKGIVKSVSGTKVYVVFQCGGDWKNYTKYTGQLTPNDKLEHGWPT